MSPPCRRRVGRPAIALVLLLAAPPAAAQGLVANLPPAARAMVEPVAQPENILVLVAFGLAAGLSGRVGWRWTVPAFGLGVATACILLVTATLPTVLWLLSLVLALWLGLIAAARLDLPVPLLAIFAAAVGFAVGLDVVPLGRARPLDLAAVASVAAGLLGSLWILVAAVVARSAALWAMIGARVAGSWIAAIAGLMLALVHVR